MSRFFALALSALFAVSAKNLAPPFSWDTPGGMVFIQIGNPQGTVDKPFDNKTLHILAKYPFVCFEKFQGTKTSGEYEDKTSAACAAVKAIDPHTSCFAYLNTQLAFTGYRVVDELYKRPELWLNKSNGKPAYNHGPNAGCRGGKCPPEGLLVPDYSIPEAGTFYLSACVNMSRDGPVDGCNLDRAEISGKPPAGGVAKHGVQAFWAGKVKAYEAAAGKVNLVINNINTQVVKGAWGNCIEGFGPNDKSIINLQQLGKEGLGAKAHCCRAPSGVGYDCTWDHVQDGLAAFLVGAGENAFFACGNGFETGPWIKWFPQYDNPLGPPLSDGKKGADGIWRRSFKSGTKVTFNSKTAKGVITWGGAPTPPTPLPPSPGPPSPSPPTPGPPTPGPPGSCTYRQDTNVDTYSGKVAGSSKEDCCNKCHGKSGCTAVVYQNGKCKFAAPNAKQVPTAHAVLCLEPEP